MGVEHISVVGVDVDVIAKSLFEVVCVCLPGDYLRVSSRQVSFD
jgi:hypothetical protein